MCFTPKLMGCKRLNQMDNDNGLLVPSIVDKRIRGIRAQLDFGFPELGLGFTSGSGEEFKNYSF